VFVLLRDENIKLLETFGFWDFRNFRNLWFCWW